MISGMSSVQKPYISDVWFYTGVNKTEFNKKILCNNGKKIK